MPTDVDNLRTRISAALTDELVRQAYKRGEYSHRYTPLDAEGNDLPELVGLDASIDPAVVADAVIEALGLRIQVAGPDGIVGTGDYRYVTEWETDD